jgi:hypothetical protein
MIWDGLRICNCGNVSSDPLKPLRLLVAIIGAFPAIANSMTLIRLINVESSAVPSVSWKPILTRNRARSALSLGCRSIEFSRKFLAITTTYDKIYSNNIEEEYEIVGNRVIVFIGWSLSTLFLVIALAGLVTPGAGKLMCHV